MTEILCTHAPSTRATTAAGSSHGDLETDKTDIALLSKSIHVNSTTQTGVSSHKQRSTVTRTPRALLIPAVPFPVPLSNANTTRLGQRATKPRPSYPKITPSD